ncbi:cytochrome c [Phenylobacterium sp. J367]|uniref:c-type cytochrome n=1 Tax=Phenylobacterium sp. J367 TaxID=2898435 RepID=UPI0021517924|nr:cytochrome c [Phenylobacterium sp. J367]MCR5879299.1 cytochrome c [Phenylobacterium sp. J367]
MLRNVSILALGLLAAACATSREPAAGGAFSPSALAGERLAWRACAGCHAVGPTGDSPSSAAPRFRDLSLKFNPLSLEHRLGQISRDGHYEMPPVFISPEEARQLTAYINEMAVR